MRQESNLDKTLSIIALSTFAGSFTPYMPDEIRKPVRALVGLYGAYKYGANVANISLDLVKVISKTINKTGFKMDAKAKNALKALILGVERDIK